MAGQVFISYSREDVAAMRRVVAFLRKQGIHVWVDNEKLVPGTPIWEEEIERAIYAASAVVVVLSPDSKRSVWVRREISLAERYQKRLFPVMVAGDEDSSITLRLITSQYVDIRENEEVGLNALSTALSYYLDDLSAREQRVKEAERLAHEKAAKEKEEREAAERVAEQKAEKERTAKAKLEEEQLAKEKADDKRKAKDEADHLAKQKADEEQIAKARMKQKHREKEKAKRKAAWENMRAKVVYVIKNYYRPMLLFLGAVLIIVIGREIPKMVFDNQPIFTPEIVHTSTVSLSFTPTAGATLAPTETLTITPSPTPETIPTSTFTPKKSLIIIPDNVDEISEIARVDSTGIISDIQYSPDGSSLVVLTTVDLVLYDSSNFVLEKQYTNISSGLSMAFTSNGEAIAVGTRDGTISLWSLINGTKFSTTFEGVRKEVLSLDFSQTGNYLAAGSGEDNVYLWRASDGLLLYVLSGHEIDVVNVAFSPDSSILVSEDGSFGIRLWQAGSTTPYKVIPPTRFISASKNGLAISPDGDILASSTVPFSNGKYDSIRLWRVSDGSLLQTFEENTNGVKSLAFSPNGEILASGSSNGTISLWRISDGKLLKILDGHTDSVKSVVFSPDGQILASGSRDGTIRLWGISP